MSEPANGAWETRYEGESYAVLPASAQVVEMPVAPGEPPCVYVRGERVLQWLVMRYGTEIVSVHESVAAARSALERSGCHSDTPDYCMCAFVVIETRTKEEPDRD